MLVFVTSLWVTEAVPYFATALLVPCLVVFLHILNDKQHPENLLTSSTIAHVGHTNWRRSLTRMCILQRKQRKR